MKFSEFEEKEYEAPLYSQLVCMDRRLWTPGQVFEGHIGVDYGGFIIEPSIFRLHGYHSYLPGASLSRYRWPTAWLTRRSPRQFPPFQLNLFIQAKRPMWGKRPPAPVRHKGITGQFWRFKIDGGQQIALEAVAAKLRDRALVVYASPAFHKYSELFGHSRGGTIVQSSTFPSVKMLSAHQAWYYNQAGAVGVANPDPTPIQEPPLEARISRLLEEGSISESWRANIDSLARAIRDALSEENVSATSRIATFFERVRQISRETEGLEEEDALSAYLTVVAFSEEFLVSWYVVGSM